MDDHPGQVLGGVLRDGTLSQIAQFQRMMTNRVTASVLPPYDLEGFDNPGNTYQDGWGEVTFAELARQILQGPRTVPEAETWAAREAIPRSRITSQSANRTLVTSQRVS